MVEKYESIAYLSVKFIRAVKTVYGKEKGVDVMNALQAELGREWAGQVLFDIMADNHLEGNEIMVEFTDVERKINAIKEIRTIDSNMGLKEAKDFLELNIGRGPVKLTARAFRQSGENDFDYNQRCYDLAKRGVSNLNILTGVRAWVV